MKPTSLIKSSLFLLTSACNMCGVSIDLSSFSLHCHSLVCRFVFFPLHFILLISMPNSIHIQYHLCSDNIINIKKVCMSLRYFFFLFLLLFDIYTYNDAIVDSAAFFTIFVGGLNKLRYSTFLLVVRFRIDRSDCLFPECNRKVIESICLKIKRINTY